MSSVWSGKQVQLFSAKNEVVNFNLVLEAAVSTASNVSVSFNQLTGPAGFTIASAPTPTSGIFSWVGRNIELFYVRYLEIKGLSLLSYEHYDERHIPKRFQRPWTLSYPGGPALSNAAWTDRPDHNKFYPDIAVPMEAVPTFNITAGQNQSIWADIYVPKTAPAGVYTGTVTVKEGSQASYLIPVSLTVRNFTLPETPTAKTMLFMSYPEVAQRYTGNPYPNAGTAADTLDRLVRNRHFALAHRHKISLIDQNICTVAVAPDSPCPDWIPRLDGTLFSAANGYDGPGVNTGNNVFSIGTYGSWTWASEGQAGMWTHTNNWKTWFNTNSPQTESFLYLIDESVNYAQTQQWAQWMKTNPGVGKTLSSFATINLLDAVSQVPALDNAAHWFNVGDTAAWNTAMSSFLSTPSHKLYFYNGKRPSNGSFAIEDDGVALRELPWAQYKKNASRWFFWSATYYNDYQGGRGQTDVFNNAQTFGGSPTSDPVLGMTGWNYTNGDGVMMYPGTDQVFPANSYSLQGPMASLRLKTWRRGIQDVDYISLAAAINPSATQAIVNQMVPKVAWDYGVASQLDPTYVYTDISWSTRPDDWEAARASLARIIETGSP